MKKIIILIILISINSNAETYLKKETFKTTYFYLKNPKITEKRVEECKTLNEMTFAIERDCENAKIAFRRSKKYKDKRNKANRDFIKQNFLK